MKDSYNHEIKRGFERMLRELADAYNAGLLGDLLDFDGAVCRYIVTPAGYFQDVEAVFGTGYTFRATISTARHQLEYGGEYHEGDKPLLTCKIPTYLVNAICLHYDKKWEERLKKRVR